MHCKIMILAFSFVWLMCSPNAFATGDCDGVGGVTIAEVQSAINMFLGITPPLSCVNENGINGVTIDEVQKTINSFLGLNNGDVVSTVGSYGTVYSGVFDGAVKPPYTTTWRMNVDTANAISGHTDNYNSWGEFINGSTVSATGTFTVDVNGGGGSTLNGNITLTGTIDGSGNVTGTWVLQNTSRNGTFTGTKEIIPNNRFTAKANGTVHDSYRNLTWLKNTDCFGFVQGFNANTVVSSLASGSCGLSDGSVAGDWRQPTIAELLALIDDGFLADTLPAAGFLNVQTDSYWSGTNSAFPPDTFAWSIDLYNGALLLDNNGSTYYVWAVRKNP